MKAHHPGSTVRLVVFAVNYRMEETFDHGFCGHAIERGGKEGGAVRCDSSPFQCLISQSKMTHQFRVRK